MLKRKNAKTHGKIRFSRYFQEFNKGDRVAIVRELALNPAFPVRIQGLVGTIEGQRGSAYIVKIKEGSLEKLHLIQPANLKKLKNA